MSQYKQYPRNDVYNHSHKQAFQQTSKNNEAKNVTNMSGTSLQLTSSNQSIKQNSNQIAYLNNKIELLQRQLEQLTHLLSDEDSKKDLNEKLQGLVKENVDLRENLIKSEQMNDMLQNQLAISERSNLALASTLQAANNELQSIRKQLQSSKKSGDNPNDSKASMKSKQQVQQDIIKLNEEISNVLQQLHLLNVDYEATRQKNISLENEKIKMNEKISSLQQQLSQRLRAYDKIKESYQISKQQSNLLKVEIHQVNEMSIQKQNRMQDQFYARQKQLHQQIQHIKSLQLQQSIRLPSQKQSQLQQNSTLVQIKNVKIRSLQLDNQYLKSEIQMQQQKQSQLRNNYKALQKQFNQTNYKLQQLNQMYKQKLIILQRNSNNRVLQLQQQIRELKNNQSKIHTLETDNKAHSAQLRSKQQKIFALEEQIRDLRRKQNIINQLQQEVKRLRNSQYEKDEQYHEVERKKMEISQQLEQVRRKLQQVQGEVRSTNEVKQRYGMELQNLKQRMKQLIQLSQDQSRQIKDIESEHGSKKKIQQDMSIISELTQNQRASELQQNCKQLQKMLMNQKIQKERQNKKYRQVIEDYKQLNQEMSTQLQLYRDASSLDHGMCPLPLKQSRQKSIIYKKQPNSAQFERQKAKYQSMIQKYQKTIESLKGLQSKSKQFDKIQKQAQFLQVQNSSMRSQIAQLNIRIEQYKGVIESMKKQAGNRVYDADQLKFSIQREYQSKMQVVKMQIINQYNVLLRNRGVRIEPPTQFNNHSQQPTYQSSINNYLQAQPNYQHIQQNVSSFNFSVDQKIRYHPDYKRLQQQYMKVYRQLLQAQQAYNKSLTQYRDQIQKLKIQNQYHRKTVDQLHAEGYGLLDQDSRQQQYRNKYQQLSSKYQRLYQQFVNLKGKHGEDVQRLDIFRPGDKIREMLRPSTSHSAQVQRSQLQWLKKTIEQKLIQLEITPREPASVIERATWVIQKLGSLVLQLRQDRDILRNQKKQVSTTNDKLKVRIQTLQYENGHLLKELQVALQKFKYLEQKNLKIANIAYSAKSTERQQKFLPIIPEAVLDQSKQKDVYLYQANKIRDERLGLIRKYTQQLKSLDIDPI